MNWRIRKKIELQLIEDGIDNQKEAELAKISEIWAEQKTAIY